MAIPPAPAAAGDPFAYGVPVCEEGSPIDFDTGGCSILNPRVVFRGVVNPKQPDYNDVYELSLDGKWHCNNLCATTALKGESPGTDADPTAYVSGNCNGVAKVNYVDTAAIGQLSLTDPGWTFSFISSGTTPAAWPTLGRAFGYWDFDNSVERVVYRGTPPNDHEIFELSKGQGQSAWMCNNLSTNDKSEAPAPPAAADPFGYCYGGVPRVIYVGIDGHIYELHPEAVGWRWADLNKATGGAPDAVSSPYAYVAGVARVLYIDANAQIIELALEPSGWKWNNLSTNDKSAKPAPPALGNPFGYIGFDGIPRVIYRSTDGHIY
ncbi:MAG TPA: hypothetical protein VIO95_11615, partial [Mycobacterium sp.]